MNDYATRIREYVRRQIAGASFGDQDDLFSTGRLNSLAAMQLVLFLEKQFAIVIEDEDLDMDNFNSVQSMVRFIERKHARAAPAASAI